MINGHSDAIFREPVASVLEEVKATFNVDEDDNKLIPLKRIFTNDKKGLINRVIIAEASEPGGSGEWKSFEKIFLCQSTKILNIDNPVLSVQDGFSNHTNKREIISLLSIISERRNEEIIRIASKILESFMLSEVILRSKIFFSNKILTK